MNEVAVLIPTRSRSREFLTAIHSVFDTSDALVFAYVDAEQRAQYFETLDPVLPYVTFKFKQLGSFTFECERRGPAVVERPRLAIVVGPRLGSLGSVNKLAQIITNNRSTVMQVYVDPVQALTYMTDDSTVGPKDWDKWLLSTIAQYPKRLGVVSGNFADESTTYINFPSMSAEMHAALGWFGPPQMHAWYWDTALEIIADTVGITHARADQLRFEHVALASIENRMVPVEDLRAFHFWCITERKQTIRRLKERLAQ